jgi:hypothetical protein
MKDFVVTKLQELGTGLEAFVRKVTYGDDSNELYILVNTRLDEDIRRLGNAFRFLGAVSRYSADAHQRRRQADASFRTQQQDLNQEVLGAASSQEIFTGLLKFHGDGGSARKKRKLVQSIVNTVHVGQLHAASSVTRNIEATEQAISSASADHDTAADHEDDS